MAKTQVPSFLTKHKTSSLKMDDVSDAAEPPEIWFDTGSCIINKIISDKYDGGFAENRMAMIAGPSGSGKSFLVGNAVLQALKAGYGALVIDSEKALDNTYMGAIGVDINSPLYAYYEVTSLTSAKKIVSDFFKLYRQAPQSEQIPYLIVIDSLDMLRTDSQIEKDEKGDIHNDQGQAVLQRGDFQTSIMHAIKHLHMACVVTKQPYVNRDTYTNKRMPYIVTEKLRFPHSQLLFVTNKLLKDKKTNIYEGINLEVYGFKSRFSKPYQKCVIEVPYESGIDWYSGVLEAAEAMGIVSKNGSWYIYGDNKFQGKNFEKYQDEIFKELVAQESKVLSYELLPEDLEDS